MQTNLIIIYISYYIITIYLFQLYSQFNYILLDFIKLRQF